MEHKETEENAMKKYTDMSLQERQAEYAAVKAKFEQLKGMGLSLNMARGKPSKVQLDLVTPIFGLLTKPEDFVSDGIDVRNYGEVAGIPAARRLFADILGCKPEQVFVGGNASLQLMYDAEKPTMVILSAAMRRSAAFRRRYRMADAASVSGCHSSGAWSVE